MHTIILKGDQLAVNFWLAACAIVLFVVVYFVLQWWERRHRPPPARSYAKRLRQRLAVRQSGQRRSRR